LLSTFEARFDVTQDLADLLLDNASHWSWGVRKAWNLRFRQGLVEQSTYAELVELGFTSSQVGSILKFVDMRYSAIKELKKYELKNLEIAIEKRGLAIATKTRKIQSLTKRLEKLRLKRDKIAPQLGKPRSAKYIAVLDELRNADADLKFCINWVKQKSRVLDAKKAKLTSLDKTIESGRFSMCFGSSKLLSQRPGNHNTQTTPFNSLDEWKQVWSDARNGQWWAVGNKNKPSANQEVQWLPDTKLKFLLHKAEFLQ
jgi:hypothetical protein